MKISLSHTLFTLITLLLSLSLLSSCNKKHKEYQGYVEGNLTYISSPIQGRLTFIRVDRGSSVQAGDLLFELEQQPELAAMKQALATVNQLQSTLDDLNKGKRPSELIAIQKQIEATQAQVDYATIELERKKKLVEQAGLNQDELDQATQNLKVYQATLLQLKSNLTTANLGDRIDRVKSAQYNLQSSEAALTAAEWKLSQKRVESPITANVFDTYYYLGEQVPANKPVLSLLDPNNIKAIFFVPETDLATLKIGQTITINCDSCKPLAATISFIAPQAEFTPPIIYSHQIRDNLRYRIEARFSTQDRTNMHPGQPIDAIISVDHDQH